MTRLERARAGCFYADAVHPGPGRYRGQRLRPCRALFRWFRWRVSGWFIDTVPLQLTGEQLSLYLCCQAFTGCSSPPASVLVKRRGGTSPALQQQCRDESGRDQADGDPERVAECVSQDGCEVSVLPMWQCRHLLEVAVLAGCLGGDGALQEHGEQRRADGAGDALDHVQRAGGCRGLLLGESLEGGCHAGHDRAADAQADDEQGYREKRI